jgi:hypothetical protein
VSLIALALAAAVSTAPANVPAPSSTIVPPAAHVDDPDKIVCHREETTGSHFKRQVCMTRAQWKQQEEAAEEYKRQVNDRGGVSGAPTPNI